MGKRTPFIKKENATKFNLVRTSQRSADDNPHILIPARAPQTAASRALAAGFAQAQPPPVPKDESTGLAAVPTVEELGLGSDGYDYSQHLKTVESAIVQPNGSVIARETDAFTKVVVDYSLGEVEHDNYESIALNAKYMDHDIAEALFNDDMFDVDEEGIGEGGVGDLLDDFIEVANNEVLDDEDLVKRGYAPLTTAKATEKGEQ